LDVSDARIPKRLQVSQVYLQRDVAAFMKNGAQRQHRTIVAILFIFYGAAHLLVISFVWFILLALAGEGYYQFSKLKTVGLVVLSLFPVLPPLLSAYSLLRKRWWANGIVISTCLAILLVNLIALMQISLHKLSGLTANRAVFVVLYGGASTALCLYGIWFVKGRTRSRQSIASTVTRICDES
jgi:hypothetical protein